MESVFAQEVTLPWTEGTTTVKGFDLPFQDLGDFVSQPVIKYVFAAAGIGLLLMLLSAGFTFLTSAGDAKKLESGKQRLTYAIVGFIIIFAAYWIVQMLGKIFGIGGIQESFN